MAGPKEFWVDKSRTVSLGPNGVTVGLLHTGRHYADDLGQDGILYHYPHTNRQPGRDVAEIAATKRAGELRIPVFVITQEGQRRSARRAWVEGFDDQEELFLVSFFEERAGLLMGMTPG